MQKSATKCYNARVMKNFKDILFGIIILLIVILLGYWAVVSIESGSTHVEKQKQQELEQKNKELEQEIEKLKNEIEALEPSVKENIPQEETSEEPDISNNTTPFKYQSLINDLQKLVDDNISMKEKSRGTRVGIIQTFLNIYNNTSRKVDNDYGVSTKTDVINFQKAEGLTADGEAGPGTFSKMIDWLKKQ